MYATGNLSYRKLSIFQVALTVLQKQFTPLPGGSGPSGGKCLALFRVDFCLGLKMSPRMKALIWISVSYETFYTRT